MKIISSSISISAQSKTAEAYAKEESLKIWTGSRPDFEGRNIQQQKIPGMPQDTLELSEESKKAFETQIKASATGSTEDEDEISFELSETDKLKILALQKMIEALTGKKIKFYVLDKVKLKKALKDPLITAIRDNPPSNRQGWGLEYEYHETYYESQKMDFHSHGTVKTADGKEINFSLDLMLSREFASSQHISLRMGDALKDPLVINFQNASAGLTEQKFSFDIDSDGKEDRISFVTPGSGFLALDVNGDGIINDGSELFGPRSGNGFGELAAYDADGNQWIDENDPIYEKLRIWTRDSEGNHQLFALGQKGIGAIYLGNVDSAFSLKNGANEVDGQIRKTGIFLRENGTAGTIQHIDLVV